MVATVDEILAIVRSNPFIDGLGYFIEATCIEPVPERTVDELTERMRDDFCMHAQVTLEGDNVLGFDFHEHLFAKGDDSERMLQAVGGLLRFVEAEYGLDHLCVEFQFDLKSARRARVEVDDLLQP